MLFNGVYVLWEDPLVLSCLGRYDRSRFLSLKLRADVLCFPEWLRSWRDVPAMIRDSALGRRHGKSLHFMCCSPDEERILKRLPMPSALVSQNAYVDERTFRPVAVEKEFDAVYVAQMKPFKRLELAAAVPRLFVVTYGDTVTPDGAHDLHRFQPAVRHAEFNRRWMTFAEINSVYNRSRVGLGLSESEGAMLASVEYMLAGLPMVSTPCRGGRELFFDDRFVVTVPPSAEAVAAGVAELSRRNLDPAMVRQATLERVETHRRALCEYVQSVLHRLNASVPTVERLHERIFGGPEGTKSVFVHSREFTSRGWV
jgi:glycosyltransferase involved in cell wall biosynthesis